jgi:cystathionine gamma-synthase
MRDVCGYEERDFEVLRHVPSGYPRFLVHPFVRALNAHFMATDLSLSGRTLWLTSSARMAGWLAARLGEDADPRPYTRAGLHGVSHPTDPEHYDRAKTYLQHVGGLLSSREAEDHLVRLSLRREVHSEDVCGGDPMELVKAELARALPGASLSDLHLANCGMSAMHAAFRAVSDVQRERGRTVWMQIGWLYLDTIAILQKLTASPGDYVYVRDVFDMAGLAALFAEHGPRLAGVVAEVPTNPLVQTPDLPALAALCRQHGARLIVDPSIVSIYDADVLPHADIVASSLTKYTASEGDLTAGLAVVNPDGPDAAALNAGIAGAVEPLYRRDAARLAWEVTHTENVLERVHASVPVVAAFLEQHPAVKDVFWALHPESRDNYRRIARPAASSRATSREAGRHEDAPTPLAERVGGMITFTLREPGALPRVYDRLCLPKGPSFGMTTTLVCPFMYLAHYDLVRTAAGRASLAADGLDPDLLRLSVGTEPTDAIVAALADALDG